MEKLNAVQNQELKADAVASDPEEILSLSTEVKDAFSHVYWDSSSEEEIQSDAILENLYSMENSTMLNNTASDERLEKIYSANMTGKHEASEVHSKEGSNGDGPSDLPRENWN